MKKSILRTANLAVIAALVCIGCNDNSAGSGGKNGWADEFVHEFNGKPDAPVTYYTLTVNVTPPNGGDVSRSPNKAAYKAGESVTVTATAADGYRFIGWSGVLNATAGSVTAAMNSDLTLTANFIEFTGIDTIPPTIQLNAPFSPNEVVKGVNFTDPGALASDGRGNALIYTSEIKNSYGNTVPAINTSAAGTFYITYTVCKTLRYPNDNTAEKCASATREVRVIETQIAPTYTLTVNKNPENGGTVYRYPDKAAYTAGEQVTVTATANTGYTFIGWSGASTSADASVTVTMSGDLMLTATWNAISLNSLNTLAEKLAWLQNNAQSGGDYILDVTADERISPQWLGYSDKSNITITLRGIGSNRTVSFSNTETFSRAMFNIRPNVTFVLDNNITLQGRGNVRGPEVTGTFIMKTGSTIVGGGIVIGRFYDYMTDGVINGTFIMEGGTISNGIGDYGDYVSGGGVLVDMGGTFIMNGGIISGNPGSGVYINAAGTFTMCGGAISGNIHNNHRAGGVGVDVGGGTFTMTGGIISNNTGSGVFVTGARASFNGGPDVYYDGTFILEGGTISGNTAGIGGGVSVNPGGSFTMTGGIISGNTSTDLGGGVYAGTFTMTGGTISGNTTTRRGGGVFAGTFTMKDGTISNNAVTDTNNYVNIGDEGLGGGGVYAGGIFILEGGTISGNTAKIGAGIMSNMFSMNGGRISNNNATYYGGGVYIMNNGPFSKTGGTITGYASDPINGNVVRNHSGAILNNSGHAIGLGVTVNSYNTIKISKETTSDSGDDLYYNRQTGEFSGDWDDEGN